MDSDSGRLIFLHLEYEWFDWVNMGSTIQAFCFLTLVDHWLDWDGTGLQMDGKRVGLWFVCK